MPPSLIIDTPGIPGAKNLDSRYGKERICLRPEVAAEMARVDDLFEKAEVRPGDKFEVLYKREWEKEPIWREADTPFLEVDNGRIICAPYAPSGKSWAAVEYLKGVLDVRKIDERS